jgi:glycosyltransferase involved in cell wall biosynthesis
LRDISSKRPWSLDRIKKSRAVLPLKRALLKTMWTSQAVWRAAQSRAALSLDTFVVAHAVRFGSFLIGPTQEIEPLSRAAAIRVGGPATEKFRFAPFATVGSFAAARVENVEPIVKELARLDERIRIVSPAAAGRPRRAAAQTNAGDRRSVVFLNNCYYNFYYLAAALRRRGWDAVSANVADPDGPHAQFYHDEDLNVFDHDPQRLERNIHWLMAEIESRFRMVHFYGVGAMSFRQSYFDTSREFRSVPIDFVRLRQRGIKIGYTVAGCLDGVAQSSIQKWSGACDKCVWQERPDVCSDQGNLAWGRKVHIMCDLVDTGGSPALDWKGNWDKIYREPIVMALDPEFWRPDIEIPEKYRLKRAPGELIVYHGVGNYNLRSGGGRNIKGTGAIQTAIERLQSEGIAVRLEFVTDVPSRDVRYIQVQADVIVDQLNYGRYGAQASEAMMLGRPTICYINKDEPAGVPKLAFLEECPIVSASEDTIYAELKALLLDPERRERLGRASRDFAVRWHSADACAERFERVYDRIMRGLPPSGYPQ